MVQVPVPWPFFTFAEVIGKFVGVKEGFFATVGKACSIFQMRDILPLCQHSFLPHVFGEVFHKILLAKGVEHIVA